MKKDQLRHLLWVTLLVCAILSANGLMDFLETTSNAAQQTINLGTNPGDGTGDTLRAGGAKINANFTELYARPSASGTVTTVTITSANGITGSVSNATTTPALTLGTNLTGLLVGTGTGFAVPTLSGLSYNSGTQTLSVTGGSGVASLGGQTGAITLSGLTMVGSVLTSNYDPTNVAITGGNFLINQSGGSPASPVIAFATRAGGWPVNFSQADGSGYGVTMIGSHGGANAALNVIGPMLLSGVATLYNQSSGGSVTGGANIYAKAVAGSGEMFVKDELGNETQISPHAADAPPDLYEIGPGADRMERTANPITGLIRWSAKERLETLLFDDMISRLGTQVQSSAAWANAQSRLAAVDGASGRSRMVAFVTETFEDYQTRTGLNLYPGATPDAQAAFQALTPSQRWNFLQQQAVTASQAAHTTWATQQAAALATGKPFTTPEPAIYVAKSAPSWVTP